MVNKPTSPTGLYRQLRDQLGSLRRVYLRGNTLKRRDDFARFDQTVLLLHGFMQTRNVWDVMEDRLRADGYGVLSFDLGGLFWRFNTRSIGDLGAMIAEKIEGIAARTGLGRFHIVGHSKGGLVARHYIQHHGGDRRAKSLITLGTPHHGTPTALLGVGLFAGGLLSSSPLEMLPGSPFVRLLRKDTFPGGIPLSSIYSRHDVVCPWWCSVLNPRPGESSLKNIPVKGIGHTALTHDPGVYTLVRRELEAASRLWKERNPDEGGR
jgi:triacylglycerol esterase/lipase EstA (alpha/beta hydrolase family)